MTLADRLRTGTPDTRTPAVASPEIHDLFRAAPLDRGFQAFHAANPVVYETLVRLARQAHALGHERVGIKMLWEVMRWEVYVMTKDTAPTNPAAMDRKLNNSYTSRYARLIMEREADLKGIFETRRLR